MKAFGFEAKLIAEEKTRNKRRSGIVMTDALGYLDFVCLMKHARVVITDSGGIQEETTALGIPCVTVRSNTERPVTVEVGTNLLAGTEAKGIAAAVRKQLRTDVRRVLPHMWDGQAADRIVNIVQQVWVAKATGHQSSAVVCV